MYKLILYQTRSGDWMWKVMYDRGKNSKILGKSGQSYKNKWHAKRAYERFMHQQNLYERTAKVEENRVTGLGA